MRICDHLRKLWLALVLTVCAAESNASERVIYLTFDDGPLPGTSNILDVIAQEQVPATMFMVGLHVQASSGQRQLLSRAKAMPFVTVGNHSYSHANNHYRNYYSDTDRVVADMLKANAVLGLTPWVYARLPGRDVFRLINYSKDEASMDPGQHSQEEIDYDYVAAMKFLIYGWDFEWVHSNSGMPVQSVDLLVSEIDHLFAYGRFMKPGSMVLLMHDQMFQDRFDGKKKLQTLIRQLRQRGYTFGAIQDYDPNPYTGRMGANSGDR
jgi:peptidoglycan/xylan/chitin deacetylase (PgdA/CDA1 family)